VTAGSHHLGVASTTLVGTGRMWDSGPMSRTVDDGAHRANLVFLTARRHVDYGRVRSAMCPAI